MLGDKLFTSCIFVDYLCAPASVGKIRIDVIISYSDCAVKAISIAFTFLGG